MLDWFDRLGDYLYGLWDPTITPGRADDGSGPPRRGSVPDVGGMDVDDAISVLARDGFRVDVVRLEDRPAPVMGTVVDQDPPAGKRRRRGSRVRIRVHHPRDPRADLPG